MSKPKLVRTLRSRAGALALAAGLDVRAGRAVEVFPDDVFVVSYPRSGNTWLRFLIANLRAPAGKTSFATIESLVPDIYANSNRALRRIPRPRILKSHEAYDARYARVIYVLRDPRNIAPSYYRYLRMTGAVGPDPDQYLERFLAGGLDRYGTWASHTGEWLDERQGSADFLVVRYEELRRDPGAELARVAAFAGLDPSPDAVAASVRASSRNSMRELEKRDRDRWKPLRDSDPEVDFVSDGSRRGLGAETETQWRGLIAEAWVEPMARAGYEA